MTMGKFIQYDYNENKGFQYPAITITKNGQINFNVGTLRKFIQNKIYVILYYDKKDNRIGFEFLSKKSKKAFKIRIANKNNLGMIGGRKFFNFYGISHIKTTKYSVEIDDETKFIVINLKNRKGGLK